MRNNPFQFSFSLPLPLMAKADFYDFHRSLQWALLLIIANSPSSLPNSFTFKPTLLLWLLFSSLQQPPIPQFRVGVQGYRYQISVWFKQLPIYTCGEPPHGFTSQQCRIPLNLCVSACEGGGQAESSTAWELCWKSRQKLQP